ncbi:MAG: alpha/beta fold hydrolase [Thermoanaerobaculia bacterium]
MLLRLYFLVTAFVLRILGARRVRFKVGETSLLAYEIGPSEGEPWVLLHGLGATALSWSSEIFKFRKQVRLLVPELSILGGTRSSGDGLNAVEGASVVTAAILRWEPDRPVTLAGISLGGWMAIRIAHDRPELVERLLLIDAAGYRDQDWERIRALTDVSHLEDVDRLYQALFYRTPFMFQMSRRAFFQGYSSPAVKHVLATTEPEDAYGPEELEEIKVPTLLIWGEYDGLFHLEVARAIELHLPNAHLVVLPRAGHAVHWEYPRATVRTVDLFRREGLAGFDRSAKRAA